MKYQNQINFFADIEGHYEQQFNRTQDFYDELLKTIQQMKEDHLQDLVDLDKKHTQLAYIKQDHLKNDMEEMEVINNQLRVLLQVLIKLKAQVVVAEVVTSLSQMDPQQCQ